MLKANGVEWTQGAPTRTSGPMATCPALINMSERYKIIQDPVNGPIKVRPGLIALLDSPEMQRLRQIRQLGLVYMVFPGAQHTRFEHSLGSMHIGGLMADSLKVQNRDELMAAALLHDVGHPPFSHTFEEIIEKKTGMNHQETGYRMIMGREPFGESTLPDLITRNGLDPSRVASIATGMDKTLEGKIISGTIDCDELDYLRRDAYYCGTTLGIVDYMRVLETILADSSIYIEEKGIPAIEELLVARLMMYRSVYWHKTARIAQNMLSLAVSLSGRIDKGIFKRTDSDLIAMLREEGNPAGMVDSVLSRKLYKTVIKLPYSADCDTAIRDLIGSYIESGKAMVDVIPPLDFSGSDRIKDDLRVKIGRKFKPLNEVSALSRSLNQAFSARSIYVTADRVVSERVGKLITSGLPKAFLSS